MNLLKRVARSIIRKSVAHAPRRVREAMLQGYMDRCGIEALSAHLLHSLKIVEIGANGDRGVITSAWNDQCVLREYAATGTFSPTLTQAILGFFGDAAGTYVDIGANIGLMTIPLARNPRIHCLAFEPEPVNFGHLRRNVARNAEGASIELHQVALFESRGTIAMALAEENLGDHRLTRAGVSGRRTIQVPTSALDDFLDRIAEPLAIKVDTQGAEPFVIAGGRKVLARAGMLAMEFCPYLMRQLGGDPGVVIDLVAGFDRIALMKPAVPETPRYVSSAEACRVLEHEVRTGVGSAGDYFDILAIRGSASYEQPRSDH
jgi:FkbM family methyltransferase